MADPGERWQLGLVASLARPGANITGVTSLAPELATKRLALLKEHFPRPRAFAVLWNSASAAEVALRSCGLPHRCWIDLQFAEVGTARVREAFAAITREAPTRCSYFRIL